MANKIPAFSYTGSYRTELKDGRWYIFFLTSGTLRMNYSKTADLYLHGGGGGGAGGGWNASGGSGGAGGYFASHYDVPVAAGTAYEIVIGAGGGGGVPGGSGVGDAGDGKAGGASSAFGYTVNGGGGGEHMGAGGVGGSGNGGYRGSGVGGFRGDGGSNTTYAFDSASGLIYGGGGGGGAPENGGSGAGGDPYGPDGEDHAAANTGAGGGGGDYEGNGGAGGSGIVILRSTQDDQLPVKFDGVTLQRIVFNGEEVMHLIHEGTQIFMERMRRWTDWFRLQMRLPQPAR